MGLIDQKARVETPDEWRAQISTARINPMPFVVINCTRDLFKTYTSFLKPLYKPACPFPTRPVREFWVSSSKPPGMVYVRESFFGAYSEHPILKRVARARPVAPVSVLQNAHDEAIPLKKVKYDDLCSLSRFCSSAAAEYFKNLPYINNVGALADSSDSESSDDPENAQP